MTEDELLDLDLALERERIRIREQESAKTGGRQHLPKLAKVKALEDPETSGFFEHLSEAPGRTWNTAKGVARSLNPMEIGETMNKFDVGLHNMAKTVAEDVASTYGFKEHAKELHARPYEKLNEKAQKREEELAVLREQGLEGSSNPWIAGGGSFVAGLAAHPEVVAASMIPVVGPAAGGLIAGIEGAAEQGLREDEANIGVPIVQGLGAYAAGKLGQATKSPTNLGGIGAIPSSLGQLGIAGAQAFGSAGAEGRMPTAQELLGALGGAAAFESIHLPKALRGDAAEAAGAARAKGEAEAIKKQEARRVEAENLDATARQHAQENYEAEAKAAEEFRKEQVAFREQQLQDAHDQIHAEAYERAKADAAAMGKMPLSDPTVRQSLIAEAQRRAVEFAMKRAENLGLPVELEESLVKKASSSAKTLAESMNPEVPPPPQVEGPTPPPVSNMQAQALSKKLVAGNRASRLFHDGMELGEARQYLDQYGKGQITWEQIPEEFRGPIERSAKRYGAEPAAILPEPHPVGRGGIEDALPEPNATVPFPEKFVPLGDVRPYVAEHPEMWGKNSPLMRGPRDVPGDGGVPLSSPPKVVPTNSRRLPVPEGFREEDVYRPEAVDPIPALPPMEEPPAARDPEVLYREAKARLEAEQKLPAGTKPSSRLRLKGEIPKFMESASKLKVGDMGDQDAIMTGQKIRAAAIDEATGLREGPPPKTPTPSKGPLAKLFSLTSHPVAGASALDMMKNSGGGDKSLYDRVHKVVTRQGAIKGSIQRGMEALREQIAGPKLLDRTAGRGILSNVKNKWHRRGDIQWMRNIVRGDDGVLVSNGREAVEGRIPSGDLLGPVRAFREFQVIASKYWEKAGIKQTGIDGSGVEFVATDDGKIMPRFQTQDAGTIFRLGPDDPRHQAVMADFRKANPEMSDVDFRTTWDGYVRAARGQTEKRAFIENTRTFRRVPDAVDLPAYGKNPPTRVQLYEVDPLRVMDRIGEALVSRLPVIEEFGQGEAGLQKFVDDWQASGGNADDAVRALRTLHGMTPDATPRGGAEIGSGLWHAKRVMRDYIMPAYGGLKANLLTSSAVRNIVEPVVNADFSLRDTAKAMLLGKEDRAAFREEAVSTGANTIDTVEAYFDANNPFGSAMREVSNDLLHASGNRWANEMGERFASLVGVVIKDRIAKGEFYSGDKYLLSRIGFSDETIARILSGKGTPEEVGRIPQSYASTVNGTSSRPAQAPLAGSNKLFNFSVPFSGYALHTMAKTMESGRQVVKAIEAGDYYQASKLASKHFGVRLAQGFAGNLLWAFATGGTSNVKMEVEDTKDALLNRPIGWLLKEYAAGAIAGPYAMIVNMATDRGSGYAAKHFHPIASVGFNVVDALKEQGSYAGKSGMEKAYQFMKDETPGLQMVEWLRIKALMWTGAVEEDRALLPKAASRWYSWLDSQGFKRGSIAQVPYSEEQLKIKRQADEIRSAMRSGNSAKAKALTDQAAAAAIKRAANGGYFKRPMGMKKETWESLVMEFRTSHPEAAGILDSYDNALAELVPREVK